jgi:hypothetical protein
MMHVATGIHRDAKRRAELFITPCAFCAATALPIGPTVVVKVYCCA